MHLTSVDADLLLPSVSWRLPGCRRQQLFGSLCGMQVLPASAWSGRKPCKGLPALWPGCHCSQLDGWRFAAHYARACSLKVLQCFRRPLACCPGGRQALCGGRSACTAGCDCAWQPVRRTGAVPRHAAAASSIELSSQRLLPTLGAARARAAAAAGQCLGGRPLGHASFAGQLAPPQCQRPFVCHWSICFCRPSVLPDPLSHQHTQLLSSLFTPFCTSTHPAAEILTRFLPTHHTHAPPPHPHPPCSSPSFWTTGACRSTTATWRALG